MKDRQASWKQWGLAQIGAPAAWEVVTGTADVVIADVGSGLGGYKSQSRTSLATPFVSGLAGLLRSQHPEWS